MLYIVRNGRTGLNGHERRASTHFRGWTFVSLDDDGFASADMLGKLLRIFLDDRKTPPVRVVSSDLRRAVQTAEGLAKPFGLPVELRPQARAWNVGDYTGLPKNAENLKKFRQYLDDPALRVPGGESLNEFRARFRPFLLSQLQQSKVDDPLILMVHSSNIRDLAHMAYDDAAKLRVVVTGVVTAGLDVNGNFCAEPLLGADWNEPESEKNLRAEQPDSASTRHTGDGKSQQTAIFFTDAKSHMAHLALQYQFIRENGIEVVGLRYNSGGDGQHIYDVWPTREGGLWFKVPFDPDRNQTMSEIEELLKKRHGSFAEFEAPVEEFQSRDSDSQGRVRSEQRRKKRRAYVFIGQHITRQFQDRKRPPGAASPSSQSSQPQGQENVSLPPCLRSRRREHRLRRHTQNRLPQRSPRRKRDSPERWGHKSEKHDLRTAESPAFLFTKSSGSPPMRASWKSRRRFGNGSEFIILRHTPTLPVPLS
jgi:broad specificity phosphatase PhoE